MVAYGAAAKGNTLLNYAGVKTDLLPVVFDAAVARQDHWMPGSRIPILAPEHLRDWIPDYVLILPWNISEEVIAKLGFIRKWGGKFVRAVPDLQIL